MNIKVGDIKDYGLTKRFVGKKALFYIGRTGKGYKSPLGNPYVIGRDGTVEEVNEKYRKWLWMIVKSI